MNSLVTVDKVLHSIDKDNKKSMGNNLNISKKVNENDLNKGLDNNEKVEEVMIDKDNLGDIKNNDRSYMIKDINYMDLIYDHVMGYYYDPKSNIYYELKNSNLEN